jgi:hypothetical protein
MKLDRGFHFSVEARADRVNQQRADKPYTGAVFAKVLGGDASSERVAIESVVGDKTINFAYPFASANAWIRGMPEPTTTMVAIIGGDTGDLQPVGYYDPAKSAAAVQYADVAAGVRQNGSTGGSVPTTVQPYRVLNPGEIDMGSEFAQTFMGLRDIHQSRGGLSHQVLTSLYASIDTPLHTIKGPAHQTGFALKDETRYGTVRRAVPGLSNPTQPSLIRTSFPNVRDPTAGLAFAKEHSVVLDWFGNLVQSKLIDHRQGHVTEDSGTPGTSVQFGRPLRARFQWYTLISNTNVEIDDAGNVAATTALEATDGVVLNVTTGNLLVNALQKLTFQSKINDIEMSTGPLSRFTVAAGIGGFRIGTPGRGDLNADSAIRARSLGTITLETPTPMAIQFGSLGGSLPKHPVLVANPTYLATQNTWLSAEAALDGTIGAYGTAAAQAWAAIGPLTMLIDPTGVVAGLCMAAAAAAGAMATSAVATNAALAAYMPTLVLMPGGYISGKTISE